MIKDGELVSNGASSLYRAGAGLALSILVGATLGIVHGLVETGERDARADGGDFLSAAEIGADPGHRDLARLSATARRSC